MAAVPYTDAIIAPSNYRPLPAVNTFTYPAIAAVIPDSEYGSLPQTLSPGAHNPDVLSPSDLGISTGGGSGGGSARPTSGMVYPRGLS